MTRKKCRKRKTICTECKNNIKNNFLFVCSSCYEKEFNQPNNVERALWVYAENPAEKHKILTSLETRSREDSSNWMYEDLKNKAIIFNCKTLERLEFKFTTEDIDKLANIIKYTVGKWIVYSTQEEISKTWKLIAKATFEGELGISAKALTKKHFENLSAQDLVDKYFICVFTKNFLDYEDVKKVRDSLSRMGFVSKLIYEPDIYTYLRFWSSNFKLPPRYCF